MGARWGQGGAGKRRGRGGGAYVAGLQVVAEADEEAVAEDAVVAEEVAAEEAGAE